MGAERAILTLNAGSSSLKFGLFGWQKEPERRLWGEFTGLGGDEVRFVIREEDESPCLEERMGGIDHEAALHHLIARLEEGDSASRVLAAVGHRVVHGGKWFREPVRVDAMVRKRLETLVHLAPLHMPHNLALLDIVTRRRPELPQVACFDTAFHSTMPWRERVFALPRYWFERGVQRYGFHGLSYEYIASVLPEHLGERAEGRVIVAHLGHGASLCAMYRRRSVATTMGMTPLDGIPMATRPGALDPGVAIWLQREGGLDLAGVERLFNEHSGLLGLSGISADMRVLLADERPEAFETVDHFIHHTHRAIASLAASLGGVDALVFTGGIGENAPYVRERICREAAWLGVALDVEANNENRTCISLPDSAVSVWRIAVDEERMIARHVWHLLETEGERRSTP